MPHRPRSIARPAGLLALLVMMAHPAAALDVVVLTTGAYKPVLTDIAQGFEAASHDTLAVTNDTAGAVAARIARGEAADLTILPVAALEKLGASGQVVPDSIVALAKSGIGIAVKTGAAAPAIGSREAFKKAMLDAPSVAYIDPASGGSSGIYIAKLFERLGIADAMKKKTILVPGGLVGSRISDGEAAVGLQQISELRSVKGVTVVGPLPAELQNYTVYGAAIPASAQRPAAGKALLAWLRSGEGNKALAARGLEQP